MTQDYTHPHQSSAPHALRHSIRKMGIEYTEELIDRIAEKAAEQLADPRNRRAADSEAWERGRRIAATISDGYTDDDWRHVLNALDPPRAARKISRRPAEDRRHLLGLVAPDRRAKVESLMTASV